MGGGERGGRAHLGEGRRGAGGVPIPNQPGPWTRQTPATPTALPRPLSSTARSAGAGPAAAAAAAQQRRQRRRRTPWGGRKPPPTSASQRSALIKSLPTLHPAWWGCAWRVGGGRRGGLGREGAGGAERERVRRWGRGWRVLLQAAHSWRSAGAAHPHSINSDTVPHLLELVYHKLDHRAALGGVPHHALRVLLGRALPRAVPRLLRRGRHGAALPAPCPRLQPLRAPRRHLAGGGSPGGAFGASQGQPGAPPAL